LVKNNYIEHYTPFGENIYRLVNYALATMSIYGILLIFYSIYLFVAKKVDAKNKLLRGILLIAIFLITTILFNYIFIEVYTL